MFSNSSSENRLHVPDISANVKEQAPLIARLMSEDSTAPGSSSSFDGRSKHATARGERAISGEQPELIFNKDLPALTPETLRDRYSQSLDKYLDTLARSLPAREGESYSSVLERTLPKMKAHELNTLTYDVEKLNNWLPLKDGQTFDILGDYGKSLLKTRLMTEYDKDHGVRSESKSRAKFSPAYDEAMKTFAQRVRKAAESEAILTKSELSPVRPPRPESKHARTDMQDKTKAESDGEKESTKSADSALAAKEQKTEVGGKIERQNDVSTGAKEAKTPEQSLSDFANSCHEFVQRTDKLIFLSKWYAPDSAMYKWGEQKFFESSQKSHQDFEKLQQVLQTQEERDRLDGQWQAFMSRQKDNLNNIHKSMPIIDEASLILDNSKQS